MQESHVIARASFSLVDTQRDHRTLPVEVWYPVKDAAGELAMYELLPGVGFFGSARESGEPIQGELPVVIVSHGHMGTRLVYSQLCEALAERGYAVFALEHPGDTMADVLLGAGVDEATNIEMRVADMDFLLDALRGIHPGFDHGLTLNFESLHALGHSFGAYTVIEWSTRRPSDVSLSSLIALEPYLLPLSGASLRAVKTPLLILAGANDLTTPVDTNVVPALRDLPEPTTSAFVLEGVGHQGCSDVGLYIETAPSLPGVPAFVNDFLQTMGADTTGRAGDPWRPVMAAHIEIVSEWLRSASSSDDVERTVHLHRGHRVR